MLISFVDMRQYGYAGKLMPSTKVRRPQQVWSECTDYPTTLPAECYIGKDNVTNSPATLLSAMSTALGLATACRVADKVESRNAGPDAQKELSELERDLKRPLDLACFYDENEEHLLRYFLDVAFKTI